MTYTPRNDAAGSPIPPDRWCQHCEQAVRLTSGRHFCEVLMAYVFGIELERMTPERLALWDATP